MKDGLATRWRREPRHPALHDDAPWPRTRGARAPGHLGRDAAALRRSRRSRRPDRRPEPGAGM